MNFDEYQKQAMSHDIGAKDPADTPWVHILGLAGEVGEIMEKLKKWKRDGTTLSRSDIAKELGDVLWYVTAVAKDNFINLREIAEINIQKLDSRASRGTLRGSGDDR